MTVVTDRRMPIQEFLVYDDGTDDLRSVFDHRRYELVDGILVEMGAESRANTQIAILLIEIFGVADSQYEN